MDYETFDNDADDTTDEQYFAFIVWLSKQTAAELRAVEGNIEAKKQVLCRYYGRGERANLTPGELIDFLAVSSPSILDAAGYTEAEADALMKLSDSLTDDINRAGLYHKGSEDGSFRKLAYVLLVV